jgi:hypothetical protein
MRRQNDLLGEPAREAMDEPATKQERDQAYTASGQR